MSISTIISSDIKNPIYGLPRDLSNLTARERIVLQAYSNETWGGKASSETSFLETKCKAVDRDLLFQILMVENVSNSKQGQLDELRVKLDPRSERVDRLRNGTNSNINTTKGRRRLVSQINMDSDEESDDDGDGDGSGNAYTSNRNGKWNSDSSNNNNSGGSVRSSGKATVYKFTIQDKAGNIFFAVNSTAITWGSCMLGSKIVIKKGTLFNRGVFLFMESQVLFLGGINRIWNEDKDLKMCEFLEAQLERERAKFNSGNGVTNTRSRKRKATNID